MFDKFFGRKQPRRQAVDMEETDEFKEFFAEELKGEAALDSLKEEIHKGFERYEDFIGTLKYLKTRLAILVSDGVEATLITEKLQPTLDLAFKAYFEVAIKSEVTFEAFFSRFIEGLHLLREMELSSKMIVMNSRTGITNHFFQYMTQLIGRKQIKLKIDTIRMFYKNIILYDISHQGKIDSIFAEIFIEENKTLLDFINETDDKSMH